MVTCLHIIALYILLRLFFPSASPFSLSLGMEKYLSLLLSNLFMQVPIRVKSICHCACGYFFLSQIDLALIHYNVEFMFLFDAYNNFFGVCEI